MMSMTASLLFQAFSVRVRRVADLEEGSIFYYPDRLLLLDAELSDDDVNEVEDQVLAAVFGPPCGERED